MKIEKLRKYMRKMKPVCHNGKIGFIQDISHHEIITFVEVMFEEEEGLLTFTEKVYLNLEPDDLVKPTTSQIEHLYWSLEVRQDYTGFLTHKAFDKRLERLLNKASEESED